MSDLFNRSGFVRKSSAGTMYYKSTGPMAPLEATPQGRLRILANTTNITDAQAEKVMPRAWASVVASRQSPRLLIGHDPMHDQIPIGKALSLEEWLLNDPRLPRWHQQNGAGALVVDFQLNMRSERAKEFHSAVAGGYLSEFSVGFVALQSAKKYVNGVTEISDISDLVEVSGVTRGASPMTMALDAKSYGSRNVDPIAATVAQYLRDEPEFARWAVSHPDQAVDLIVAHVNRRLDGARPSTQIPRPERSEPAPSAESGHVAMFHAALENAALMDDLPARALINAGISIQPRTFMEELKGKKKANR